MRGYNGGIKMTIFAAVIKQHCYETPEHHRHHPAEHPVLHRSAVVLFKERIPPALSGQCDQGVLFGTAAVGHLVCQLLYPLPETLSGPHFAVLAFSRRGLPCGGSR